MSVGKIGHLILKDWDKGSSNYINVMATHASVVRIITSPRCNPPLEKKSYFWQHFSSEFSWDHLSWGSIPHATRSDRSGGASSASPIPSTLQAAASALPNGELSAGV